MSLPATPLPEPYLEVIDSFAIPRTGQFFMIGHLHGAARPDMFARIVLNAGLDLTVRIAAIEEVAFAADKGRYTLLEMRDDDPDFLSLMLGLNVGLETVRLTVEGED